MKIRVLPWDYVPHGQSSYGFRWGDAEQDTPTLKYGAFGIETAKNIKGEAICTAEKLYELARKCLNGREVSFACHGSSLSEIYADKSPF